MKPLNVVKTFIAEEGDQFEHIGIVEINGEEYAFPVSVIEVVQCMILYAKDGYSQKLAVHITKLGEGLSSDYTDLAENLYYMQHGNPLKESDIIKNL